MTIHIAIDFSPIPGGALGSTTSSQASYAYADTLESAGRESDALAWFHRTNAIDSEELTDAAERADLLERKQS